MAPNKPRQSVIMPLCAVQLTAKANKVTKKKGTRRKRNTKMYANEKCTVCDKPADGVKYNAISCDSCRVFYRRIILAVDKDPTFKPPCKCGGVVRRHDGRDAIEVMLKCQRCRLEKCHTVGMEARYVTGHSSHNDLRTVRKRSIPLTWASSLDGNDTHVYDTLMMIYNAYVNGETLSNKVASQAWASSKELKYDLESRNEALSSLRKSLRLYISQVSSFFKVLSDAGILQITPELQMDMTLKSYGDCVVIRWCENFDEERQEIRGINGHKVSCEQLKAMSFATHSEPYVRNMHRLRALKADRQDLAMLCFLCLLTGDRGVVMSRQQRERVFKVQENAARLLADKCKFNNQRLRFAKLIEVITEFRSDLTCSVKDFRQVLGWEKKIYSIDTIQQETAAFS